MLINKTFSKQHFSGQRLSLIEYENRLFHLLIDNKEGVNTFNQQMLDELNHCLHRITESKANGLLISSEQRLFLAGGDIKEFQQRFALPMPERTASLNAFGTALNTLSQLPCPSVALLNGAALGGGVELALCCDYRLALPNIKIGLPEVTLGIIPGTGGCVRLPRLIGLPAAAQWICHGTIYRSEHALEVGLIDGIEDSIEAMEIAATKLIAAHPQGSQRKQSSTAETENGQHQLSQQYQDDTLLARQQALRVISQQAKLPLEQALALETAVVAELGATLESHRLVAAFVAGS